MATRRSRDAGPSARRVRINLAQLRERRGVSLRALSKRLEQLGHPLMASGLSKIETGDRRADVDDLLALAIALDVSPNGLLLPGTAHDQKVELTPEAETTELMAWRWATGEAALRADLWTDRPVDIDLDRSARFRKENRPHDHSGETSLDDLEEHEEALAPAVRACREAIEKSGLPREDVLQYISLALKLQEWFGPMVKEAKGRRTDDKGGRRGKHR